MNPHIERHWIPSQLYLTCEHMFEYWVTRVMYNMVSELDLCFLLKDSEGLVIGLRELLYVTEGTHFCISNSKITRFLSGLPLVPFVCLFYISWKEDLFLSRCSSTSLVVWKWSLQGSPGDHHWLGFLCKEVCASLWRFFEIFQNFFHHWRKDNFLILVFDQFFGLFFVITFQITGSMVFPYEISLQYIVGSYQHDKY